MRAWAGLQAPRARAVSIQYYYPRSEPKPNTHRNSPPDLIPLSTLAPRSFLRPSRSLCAVSPSAPSRLDRRPNRARSSSPGDSPPADSSVRLDPGSPAPAFWYQRSERTAIRRFSPVTFVLKSAATTLFARKNDSIARLAPLGTKHRTANLALNRPSVCIPEHPRPHCSPERVQTAEL